MIRKAEKAKITIDQLAKRVDVGFSKTNKDIKQLNSIVERLAVSVAKGFEETTTKADFARLEKRLDQKIDGVEKRLDQKIDGVEQRLELKIDGIRSIIAVDHGHRIEKLEKG